MDIHQLDMSSDVMETDHQGKGPSTDEKRVERNTSRPPENWIGDVQDDVRQKIRENESK